MINIKKVIATLSIYFIVTSMFWLLIVVNTNNADDNLVSYYLISGALTAVMCGVLRLFEWSLKVLNNENA
jgi:hypothetical protein